MTQPSPNVARPWSSVTSIPSFFDRLEAAGGISVRGMIEEWESATEFDGDGEVDGADDGGPDGDTTLDTPPCGIVYHDRGIRVPGYDVTFVWEPPGSRAVPTFSVEVDTVGPRSVWATFDASMGWDVYYCRADDVAAVAWMTDEEFAAEEVDRFATKDDAVAGGRFSFGAFVFPHDEWAEKADALAETDAPAYLLRDDGKTFHPRTQDEFYRWIDSTPEAFRSDAGGAPPHLGIFDLEVSIGR